MSKESDGFKRDAAFAAVDGFVRSGMTVGLGTGTTASWVVRRISEHLDSGRLTDVTGIPTSEATAELARETGVPLATLAERKPDITLDGADEIAPSLDVIKGLGGALLREKIVAFASAEGVVIVADSSKLVEALGAGKLPVEVEPYGWEATLAALTELGCEATLRPDREDASSPFVTDGGHYTADCVFPDGIPDPVELEVLIRDIPGALECGLFTGLTRAVVVAGEGGVSVEEPDGGAADGPGV